MTHGNEVPTLTEIEDSKKAMDDIQSFTYATSSSFTDSKGVNRITTRGLEANYIQTAVNGGIWAEFETFTALNQYMVFTGGTAYKPKNSTSLPYIVGATPDTNFVEVTGNLSTGQGDIRYDRSMMLSTAVSAVDLIEGQTLRIADRADALFDVVTLASLGGGALIGADEINLVGCPLLALKWRTSDKLYFSELGAKINTVSAAMSAIIKRIFDLQEAIPIPIHMAATGMAARYTVDVQCRYFGFGWTGDGRFNTQIQSTFIGVQFKKMNSNDEGRVQDFTVLGRGLVGVDDGIGEGFGPDGVIGMGADGSGAGWTRMQMTNVHWRHMAQQFEMQQSLWCTFINVYARFVRRGVFFVGGTGQGAWNTDWFNNQITFLNCLWDDTGEYAIDYVGSGLALSGTTTFQSGVDGLRINRDPAGRSNNNTIDNLYTEFNSGSDMIFDGVKVTIGTVQYLGGSGTETKPNTLNNILANNTQIIATGRPSILDTQINRITLTNNSKYIAMYPEIVSVKNTADATSEFIYLPDRVADKTIEEVFTNLSDSVPVEIAGGNLSTRSWAVTLEAPSGEFTSFTLDVGLVVSSFRMLATGLQVVAIDVNNFQINFATIDYTFTQSGANGTITIVADGVDSGDVTLRMVLRIGKNVPTF